MFRALNLIMILIAFVLVTIPSFSFGQNCEYEKNEVDKFTKSQTVITAPVTILSKNLKIKAVYTIKKIDMQLQNKDGRRSLIFSVQYGIGASSVLGNDKAILLLAGGETVELQSALQVPNMKVVNRAVGGDAVMGFEFQIDDDAFKKLSATNVTDIRIVASLNPIEFSIKEGVNTAALFGCIK